MVYCCKGRWPRVKKRDKKASSVWLVMLLIFLLPGGFFILCGMLLLEPLRYIRLRRSRYRRDFPTRYKFPCETHPDSLPYGIIKEQHLPIDYRKDPRSDEACSFFIYGDTLLHFSEPFIYFKEQDCWLTYFEYAELIGGDTDTDPTDADGVPYDVESETLEDLNSLFPDVHCERVVWFVCADKIKNTHERDLLAERPNVVLYTKKTLADTLRTWIQHQSETVFL